MHYVFMWLDMSIFRIPCESVTSLQIPMVSYLGHFHWVITIWINMKYITHRGTTAFFGHLNTPCECYCCSTSPSWSLLQLSFLFENWDDGIGSIVSNCTCALSSERLKHRKLKRKWGIWCLQSPSTPNFHFPQPNTSSTCPTCSSTSFVSFQMVITTKNLEERSSKIFLW